MKHNATRFVAIAVITVVLAGCGGGVTALLGLIGIGSTVADISDLFSGSNEQDADVLLDGQVIRTVDRGNSTIRLQGLPEGRHLLQIVASDSRGILRVINVDAGSDVQLGELQAQDGGLVSGRVTLKASDNSVRAAARVPVYAIPGGAARVAAGSGVTSLPPATTHYVTYTDGNGEYSLRALAPGDYLVTAAVGGYMADVQFIQALTVDQRQRNKNLELDEDNVSVGAAAGVVLGRTSGGSSSLGGASLRARLSGGYSPDIPQDTINRIENAYGGDLRGAPWFQWQVLSTLADPGGSYQLSLPAGTPRIDAFSYGYQPTYREPAIVAGTTTAVDFTLEDR